MKIRSFTVHNFRSIQHVCIDVCGMLVLLGPNNHGKSNVLAALEFGLTTSAKPVQDDFFADREASDRSLWVEMTFDQLTEQEKTTFLKYVRDDGTVTIRKTALFTDSADLVVGYQGYVQEPDEWWLKESAFERLNTKDKVRAEAAKVPAAAELLNGGRITKERLQEFQGDYIKQHGAELNLREILEEGPLLGLKNVAGGMLPEFYLVPAVRDLSDETRTRSTSVFGRLLQRAVQDMTARDPEFLALQSRLQSLIHELNNRTPEKAHPSQLAELEDVISSELEGWGVKVSIQVMPPELEKILELGTELHLDDGLRTLAARKGHGLQRAVLFALLRAWAKVIRTTDSSNVDAAPAARRSSDSTYFAIEEPELFLHPHAQRQLYQALRDLAASPGHQVFMSTHSTHFVDLDSYQDIAICHKPAPDAATQVRQCVQSLFNGHDASDRKNGFHMATWVNPDRGELFFAKKVVLVEGETEKVLLPFLASKFGCIDPDVSIIDCGSKFNLRLYITILNAFRIPYYVIHDVDPFPDSVPVDWSSQRRSSRKRAFEENALIKCAVDGSIGSIGLMCPDFEGVSGVSRNQGEKKGKALAALDHFMEVKPEDVPSRLAEVVQMAYTTKY